MKKKRRRKLTRPHDDIFLTDEIIEIAEDFLDEIEEDPAYKDFDFPVDILDNVIDMIAKFKREYDEEMRPAESPTIMRRKFRLVGSDETPDDYDDPSDLTKLLQGFEAPLGTLEDIIKQLDELEREENRALQKSKFKLISNTSLNSDNASSYKKRKKIRPLYTIDENIIMLHNISKLKIKPRKKTPKLKRPTTINFLI